MTFIVTDACIECKYTDCVDVCPVDCFHEGPNFLIINPNVCIDCALCKPECPVDAIYEDSDIPPNMEHFVIINKELSLTWPIISKSKDQLYQANDYKNIKNKYNLLIK